MGNALKTHTHKDTQRSSYTLYAYTQCLCVCVSVLSFKCSISTGSQKEELSGRVIGRQGQSELFIVFALD